MKCRLCGRPTEFNFCSEACAKYNNELMSRGNYASPEDRVQKDRDNWIRLNDRNIAEAFGPDASHLLLHHRKDLDELVRNWKRQDRLNQVLNQLQYVRNSHFLFDSEGNVRAAGTLPHCLHYMLPGYVVVIRESLERPCTCENNGDYCPACLEARA